MKKKKLLVTALIVALVCLLAANVSAAGTDVCPCCGTAYDACNWQPWTLKDGGTSNALTTNGHYYMTEDVPAIKSQIRIGNGTAKPKITLDLRGHTITSSNRVFGVYGGATLSILDTVGGGIVQGEQVGNAQVGGTIRVNEAATLNLYGGTIRDNATKDHAANGAVIATEGKNCIINIAGGNVEGGTKAPHGGAIFAARGAKVTVSSGTITGGKADFGGAIYTDGAALTVTGGSIAGGSAAYGDAIYATGSATVTIRGGTVTGSSRAVYMHQQNCSLTLNSTAGRALTGKVFLEDDPKISCGYGLLKTDGGVTKGPWYYACADAMAVYQSDRFLRPMGNGSLDLEGKTVVIDVNNRTLTIKNGKIRGFDSANDSYNASKCGTVTLGSTASCLETNWTAPNGNSYITVRHDDGKISFHRYYMAIEHVTLRTEPDKEGMYFNSYFAGDTTLQSYLSSFGIAMSKQNLQTQAAWKSAMETGAAPYSVYTANALQAGVAPENQTLKNGTLLKNIINYTNSVSTNVANTNTVVYGIPYMKTVSGEYILGVQQQAKLYDLLDYANTNYHSLSEGQRAGLLLMYERLTTTMNRLPSSNIRASFDDEILAARRYTVYHEMEKMGNILWTVDKKVTFSITATSKGVTTDLANQQAKDDYDPLDDDIITLYPDRIYQGLPYTHASASNESICTLGVRDENNVYHLSNAVPELFNGGSTDGSKATTGKYNISRIGNDCWDMVHWAWTRVSTSVTADQTNQMTPSFGVEIIGYDLLEKTMQALGTIEAGSSMLDYICTKSTASATKGMYIYKNIPDTEPNGHIDGTRLVRYGIRRDNGDGTYDYQALYQTYAMMQKGDAMVRWRNGSGHAVMCGGIQVIYTADGRIDGTKSTMIMLEQGSGHEERQSRLESEFSTSVTAKHSSHTKYNKSCKYCAGYTDEVIDGKHVWRLDYEPRPITFQELMEADYIAVTCAELNDPDFTEPPAASISGVTGDVSTIYSGTINANYRISKVTLNIYDANGDLVNTSAVFGIQDGVRSPLALSRFVSDYNLGVTAGTPAIRKSGTKLVAPDLAAGKYTYAYIATLGYGRSFSVYSGSFTVTAAGSVV